ncbi:MAG TPA: alkyl sulfatase dimerization domain-containing protein [Limnobacter sp.]|nr:alkyl sulfatase dimerization domain-containing protein [Limnobacter sp.]
MNSTQHLRTWYFPGLLACATLFVFGLAACSKPEQNQSAGKASDFTQAMHAEVAKTTDLVDTANTEDAKRGLIAKPTGQVKNAAGEVIWDYDAFNFIEGNAPPTVNPSLWRQAALNNQIGLYKVAERIYQLRGFDLSNITLIEGKTGWIVVDVLTSEETARAAMAFARQHLGNKPVSAVIFTHSHVDHFGGALGVVSAQEVKDKNIPVVAPSGFMEEATSENVLVGMAMARRSVYMYGKRLPKSPEGLIDNGLGKAVAYGRVGILEPSLVVKAPKETHTLDGLEFEFLNVPGSEAPSEFVFYVPQLQAFGGAELFGHTLHNLYTPRGAKVRDALKWAGYMDEAIAYADSSEVLFHQHNWPVWGSQNIRNFMEKQRDTYRFIHDQTVRKINAGETPVEIAENLKMPAVLHNFLSARGYYGTVSHNVKAVYQMYMGWFDANPANLNPIPPVEAAKRYVALAGGMDALMSKAQTAHDQGDYRWSAELLKHAVYADPDHLGAKALLASGFEQMGYQAESAPWRNFYLTGALELRKGGYSEGFDRSQFIDMLMHTPTTRFLEAMAASLNGEESEDKDILINLVFTDNGETYQLHVKNSVLHHRAAPPDANAAATLKLTKPFFLNMLTGEAGAIELLFSDDTQIEGSRLQLGQFFGLLDKATGNFNIVTP